MIMEVKSQENLQCNKEKSNDAEGVLQKDPNASNVYTSLLKVTNARERIHKKLAMRKNPFFCTFCKIELKTKGNFMEHYLSKEHRSTMATTLKNFANLIGRFYIAIQDAAFQESTRGRNISMCRLCLLPHTLAPDEHLQSAEHKLGIRLVKLSCRTCNKFLDNRIEMEKHLGSLTHIRNHFKNFDGVLLEEDLKLPEMDVRDVEPPGSHYIYDATGYHCSVCDVDIKGSSSDLDMLDHCRTKVHFLNYKEHYEVGGEAVTRNNPNVRYNCPKEMYGGVKELSLEELLAIRYIKNGGCLKRKLEETEIKKNKKKVPPK